MFGKWGNMAWGAFSTASHRNQQEAYAREARARAEAVAAFATNPQASGLLGNARSAHIADLEAAGMCDVGGLYLGALNGQMLFYHLDGHLLTLARARSGKGRDVILPNLAHVRGRSLVVNDVKDGENYAASHHHRRDNIGDRIITLNPWGLHGAPNVRVNPARVLVEIIEAGGQIDTEADELILILIPETGKGDPAWRQGARRLLALRLEYLAIFRPERCTLSELWRWVNAGTDETREMLNEMILCGREGITRRASAWLSVFDDAPKQWEGYRQEAIGAVAPYQPGSRLALATDGHDVDLGRLKVEPSTVYLMAPSKNIGAASQWLSLIVNYMIETIANRVGPLTTTFLLDEFGVMPAASAVEKGVKLYAGKGCQFWMFAQGRHSIASKWPVEMVREFEDQAAIFQTWGVEDPSLLKDISTWSGTTSVAVRGFSQNGGVVPTGGLGIHEQPRPVLQTEDIRAIGDRRQLLKIAGVPHLVVAERIPFYEVDPWKDQIGDVRVVHKGAA
jgi:type IV secretion system protein VirD4